MPTYTVRYTDRFERQLAALDRPIQRRVTARVDALANNPRPPGCRLLVGADDLWRVRVGDYRIVYQVEDDRLVVMLVEVGHRREVYRR